MENDGRLPADELLNRAEDLIADGDLAAAQSVLDEIEEKSGRKYFVQSKLFESKKWFKEQRVQLLYAINAEPENAEYRVALECLEERQSRQLSDEDYFERVEEHLRLGEIEYAQNNLNRVQAKSGKKFYLQSRIYKQRKWYNEQRKQLKAAVKKEPENEEYKKELAELEEFSKTAEFKKYRREEQGRQMGECCVEGCAACGDGCVGGCGAGC